jgi:hypothetical protein
VVTAKALPHDPTQRACRHPERPESGVSDRKCLDDPPDSPRRRPGPPPGWGYWSQRNLLEVRRQAELDRQCRERTLAEIERYDALRRRREMT